MRCIMPLRGTCISDGRGPGRQIVYTVTCSIKAPLGLEDPWDAWAVAAGSEGFQEELCWVRGLPEGWTQNHARSPL